jgi:hypothetical protein
LDFGKQEKEISENHKSTAASTMPTGQMKRATLLILAVTAPLTLAFAPIIPSGCLQRNRVTLASTTEEKAASNVEVEDNPRKLGLALMLDDGECLFLPLEIFGRLEV